MYMHQKKLLKWRILSFSILVKFGPRPCTIVQEYMIVNVLTLDKGLFLEGGKVGLTNPSASVEEAALPTGAGPVFACRGFCTVSLESERVFNSITF